MDSVKESLDGVKPYLYYLHLDYTTQNCKLQINCGFPEKIAYLTENPVFTGAERICFLLKIKIFKLFSIIFVTYRQ